MAATTTTSDDEDGHAPISNPSRGGGDRRWAKRIVQLVAFLLAFSPAFFTAGLVDRFAVDVPHWDDWERATLIKKWHDGDLSWNDLYAPHIEHRIVVQRLVMLASNALTDGDLRSEMWCLFAIVLATALALFFLLKKSFATSGGEAGGGTSAAVLGAPFYLTVFSVNLLVFSTLQWQNFLWAIQVAFVSPMAGITAALLVLTTRWKPWLKFVVALLAALAATHGFGHGILVWPTVFLAVLLGRSFVTGRARWVFLAAWLAAAALVSWSYFNPATFKNVSHASHAYTQSHGERPPGLVYAHQALERPEKLARFTLAALGNSLGRVTSRDVVKTSTVTGAILLACFAAAAGTWLWRWRDDRLWDAVLPWLALGGVAVVAAFMIALARSAGLAVDRAVSPRYMGITLYLCVAVIVLAVIYARRLVLANQESRRATWLRNAGWVAVGGFVVVQALLWDYGVRGMRIHHAARQHGKTDLMFINHFRPDQITRLDLSYGFLKQQANTLHDLGYLDVPLLPDTRLSHFKKSGSPLSPSRGQFPELTSDGEGNFTARGFAELPKSVGRPADGVLMVTVGVDGERTIFGIADRFHYPPIHFSFPDHEFDALKEFDEGEFTRWEKTFHVDDLPELDEVVVEAWAVDSEKRKVYRLIERYVVRPGDHTVARLEETDGR